jgi:hypothetical protein
MPQFHGHRNRRTEPSHPTLEADPQSLHEQRNIVALRMKVKGKLEAGGRRIESKKKNKGEYSPLWIRGAI